MMTFHIVEGGPARDHYHDARLTLGREMKLCEAQLASGSKLEGM